MKLIQKKLQKIRNTSFVKGLVSDGEPTSGFFKLQKIRTWRKIVFLFFLIFSFAPLLSALAQSGDGFDVNLYVISSCNNNLVCEADNGEDRDTCPNDCIPPGAPAILPLTENIYISNIRVESEYEEATVRWESSVATAGTLRYGQTIEVKDGSLSSLGYTGVHSMKIINLRPGTMYFFSIESTGVSGKTVFFPPNYFFTKFLADTTFPRNPTNAKAATTKSGINLSWVNPTDENFAFIRIMRHDDRFRGNPTLGKLIYEGTREEFLDTGVEQGREYFYSLFSKSTEGEYSSGVGVSATAYRPPSIPPKKPDVKEPPKKDPVTELPTPTPIEEEPEPAKPVFSPEKNFYVHQYGEIAVPLEEKQKININGSESTIVDTNQKTEFDDWMRITDEEGQLFGNYLFSFNKNSGRYQGVIPPLSKPGIYKLEIFRYFGNSSVKIAEGYITVGKAELAKQENFLDEILNKIDLNWLFIIGLVLAWFMLLVYIFGRRRRNRK